MAELPRSPPELEARFPDGAACASWPLAKRWPDGFPFPVHPHVLRRACGFELANDGKDTRALQERLGHSNIQHTELTSKWSKNFGRERIKERYSPSLVRLPSRSAPCRRTTHSQN